MGEAEGILAWAIEGAAEWYRNGLGDPPVIVEATKTYKETSDELAGFVGWVVVADTLGEIRGAVLYEAYRDWANHEGVKPWTRRALYEAVIERMPGVKKVKREDGVWLEGVRQAATAESAGFRPAELVQREVRNDAAPDEHDVTDAPYNSFTLVDSSLVREVSKTESEASCSSGTDDEVRR
jgi:putative DNA primase/helicase